MAYLVLNYDVHFSGFTCFFLKPSCNLNTDIMTGEQRIFCGTLKFNFLVGLAFLVISSFFSGWSCFSCNQLVTFLVFQGFQFEELGRNRIHAIAFRSSVLFRQINFSISRFVVAVLGLTIIVLLYQQSNVSFPFQCLLRVTLGEAFIYPFPRHT